MEEISEKYDKLVIKYRDSNKDMDNLKNIRDVLQAQKDNCEEENLELKNYVNELENIVKNGGSNT